MAVDPTYQDGSWPQPSADDLSTFIGSFAQAFWETDAAGVAVTDSPSWRAYTGQTLEQWLTEGWVQAVHPDDRARALEQWQEAVQQQSPVNADFRTASPDNHWRWTHVWVTPILNADGSVKKWLGLTIDMTERMRAGETLRKREAELARIQEIGGVAGLDIELGKDIEKSASWRSPEYKLLHGLLPDTDYETHEDWLSRVHPDDREQAVHALKSALSSTQNRYENEYRIIRPIDGQERWLYARLTIERNATGNPTRLIGAHIDITARKQAEEALLQAHAQTREILESIGDVFYAVDQDFNFTYLNHKAEQTWGRPAAEVLGQSMWTVFPQAIGSESYRMHLKAMHDRQPVQYETISPVINRWISISIYPSAVGGLSVYFHDINVAKQAQDALRESEERFRTLVQNLPDYAIFSLDPNGIITEWTEGAQRVKGYTAEEAIGQSIAIFFTPEDLAAGKLEEEITQAVQTGRAEREILCVRKGGQRFWINEITTAIRDSNGQLVGFTKISRDITQRKQTEEALRDSQERLQIVMSSIADHAIITSDTQNRITGWNPGAQHLFGYSEEEIIGQSGAILFTPEDQATGEPEKEVNTARQRGRAADERYHIRKDGSRLYVSGVMSPLYDAADQLLGYVKVARDLTERQRMEEALRETNRRKDEFLAMLAHELRNPLAPVRNGLQILTMTSENDETVTSVLSMMNRQVDHLVRLVDDLLDVSRISRGRIELRRERLDLTKLVSQAAETARPFYESHGRQLSVTLPDFPIYLDGDPTRLTQVVTNLLTNGVRYTRKNGHVWLTLELADEDAVLRVRDNGIGLAADQLEVIFELFVQIDNSLARAQGGLGLGLTLVRRLVEMHGGRVEAHSEGLDRGSEFKVRLPTLHKREKSMTTENQNTTAKAPGYRILVIDDNQDSAVTLTMLLKIKGHDVQTRYGGRSGLEAAESLRPEVIILDIGMPEMDGYETCRQLRQRPWGKEIVVVALTGYGQEEDKRRTREAGFDGHLVKPVDMAELTQLLVTLLPEPGTV